MQKIDVFVLTSIWEGFGYVLVEAMACQKPTIAFDLSSNPEIIENNKTGFLIEFDKVEKMADKIEYFINKNEKLYEFGLYAKNRAEKLFTIEKSYNNLKEFLGF
jgi:glycosyltransferase involved in cell wall biosynthesis